MGGGGEFCPGNPTSTVGTVAELEAAQSDYWTAETNSTSNGIRLLQCTRIAYSHGGDEILYGYYRTWAFNSCGRLASVSGETRVIIDTPEVCSTA